MSTIAAIATPPGRGGLGILRLSGPQSRAVAEALLRFPAGPRWEPWRAALATLAGPAGEAIDQVVVTFFAAPRSYTAEDVVEIACHGSPVVLRHALECAVANGAELAGPGEFTLRAFLNGRIDLPQAEAVGDLIAATTLYQAKVAARQLDGSVAQLIKPWKEQLVELIALLEAGIDFADDDVAVAGHAAILARLEPLAAGLAALTGSYAYGRLVHDGLTLAIAGRPNVGKSSLFNRLLEQDRAIVTPIPGTTRDTVSETTAMEGIPLKLIDTAGVRAATDTVEALGVERTYRAMADADVTLVVLDLSQPLTGEDEALFQRARAGGRALIVGNKCDLPVAALPPPDCLPVSALTGAGVEVLRQQILAAAAPHGVYAAESGFITSLRQAGLLRESADALGHAREAVAAGLPHEMLLLDCYAALQPLDSLTGATTADDILHRIFATFCIGK